MGKNTIVGLAVCLCELLCAQDGALPILKELRAHGGLATFELTVKDDQGKPVLGAKTTAGFWQPRGGASFDEGSTDAQGKSTLSGEAWMDGIYSIKKEGYYETRGEATFQAPIVGFSFFERRRWLPVVRTVTLKKVRNPIPLVVHGHPELPVVRFDKPIGLDLEAMDWVYPDGNGKYTDILVTFHADATRIAQTPWAPVENISFDFTNPGDGLQFHKTDMWSDLRSAYCANVSLPFESRVILHCDGQGHAFRVENYLIVRVRSQKNETGEIISANYAKLYGGLSVREGKLRIMAVYFNPRPNDTNLEFDPERNLVPEKELRRRRVLRP